MVIEWLKFKVSAEDREKFILQDEAIWTAKVAKYPGFLSKEIWINPTQADEVTIVIRWQTREQWKAIPPSELEKTEEEFKQAMEGVEYQLVEAKEYQVRKFPQASK